MDLLEREPYLAQLKVRLDAVDTSGGCVMLIGGEAGIGKTALLQRLCAMHSGMRVLWGGCDDLFTPRPLAPLHDIARQTQGGLRAALGGGASREAIFGEVLLEFESVPTLAVFEDVHWADEATLDLLKFLGRRIARTRTMLTASYRDTEVGRNHPLRFVMGDLPRASTHKMTLAPLSVAGVAELAKTAGRRAEGLHDVTGGNPLFVSELLAAEPGAVPSNVRDAVLARAIRLPPSAREFAEFVCVVPGKAEAWLAAGAEGPDDSSIDLGAAIGLLHLGDGAFAFRHELIRQALLDSLAPKRKRELHARVLALLEARAEVPAARLAHHAVGALDGAAVRKYGSAAAAQAVALGAHREAAAHYEAVLAHAPELPFADRARLQEHLSYELYLTDQVEKALGARQAALEIWRACDARAEEGDALRWMSRLSWFAGRGADARRHALAAVTALEPLPKGRQLAMAYSNLAQLEMLGQEKAASIRWAGLAIEIAASLADEEILSHALNNLGCARVMSGDEGGWADLEKSLTLALRNGLQEHAARAYTNLSYQATERRQYPAAMQHLTLGIAYCEQHDLDSWRLYMLATRSRARFEQGDWEGASDDTAIVLQHPRTASITRVIALTVLGLIRARRGDPDAFSPLHEAKRLAEATGELQRVGPVAVALAEAAELSGRPLDALEVVRAAYGLALERGDPWQKGELALWLWRMGALVGPVPPDIAAPYRLEIAGDNAAAANAWQELGCPYERGCLLAKAQSAADQKQALELLEKLGAAPAAAMLRRQMQSKGVRGIARGPRTSTLEDPHGLTVREAEILGLMAEGLRNAAIAKRLFVSTRTVDHHVSAILAKLGAKSRSEAIAVMHARSGETG